MIKRSLFLAATTLLAAASLPGATVYWDGADSTADADGGWGTWNTSLLNWDSAATAGTDSLFTSGDNAVFGGAAGVVTLGSSITAGTVTFNTAGYTLNTGSNNYTLSLTGFAGAGGFTKAGTGTLTLSGYTRAGMTMSGGITVDAGTLVFGTSVWNGAGSASAWASPLTITVNSGAQLKTTGAHYLGTTTNVTLNSGGSYYQTGDNYHMGTWTLNGGSITGNTGNYRLSSGYQLNVTEDSTISNVIFVSFFANAPINVVAGKTLSQSAVLGVSGGSFRKQGAGTWVINNTNTSNNIGALTIDAGTFKLASSAALGSAGAYSGTLANNGVFQYSSSAAQTISGVISGSGVLLKDTASSTLTLTGVNTYSGATSVSAGVLEIGGAGQLGAGLYTGDIANAGTLRFNTTANQTLAGVISGAGALVNAGSGTLTLAGTNSLTGATTVNAGMLRLASTGTLEQSDITLNAGAAFRVDTAGKTLKSLSIGGDAVTLALAVGPDGGVGTTITGDLSLGGHTLTLTPIFSGIPTAGVYNLFSAGSITGALGAVSYDVTSSRLSFATDVNGNNLRLTVTGNALTDTWSTASGTWDLNTTANWTNSDTGTFYDLDAAVFGDNATLGATTGTVTLSGTLTPSSVTVNNNSGVYVFQSGVIAGTGALIKGGAGGLRINAANTFSGGVRLSGSGYLTAQNAAAFGTGTIAVTGGTPTLSGANLTVANPISIADGAALTINFGRGVNGAGAGDITYSGAIASGSTGGLTVTAAGTSAPTSVNFTGSLSGFQGAIALNSTNGNINMTSAASGVGARNAAFTLSGTAYTSAVGNGGTFEMGSLAGSGKMSVNGVLSVGGLDTSTTYSGVMSNNGTGALTKVGSGTLTLSGANTYTGATTVGAGRLALSSTAASTAFNIASGATLEFSGTISNTASTTFSGAGTLEKTGIGAVSWTSGAATFALDAGSQIRVLAGQLTGGSNANEVWTNNKSSLYVASGATFAGVEANVRVDALTGAGTVSSGFTGAGYQNFTFGVNNGSGAFDGILADGAATGNFVKAGSGTQTLTGVNTYTGGTSIAAGVLEIAGSGKLGGATGAYAGAIANAGTLRFNSTAAQTLSGVISGAGALVKDNSGSLTLSGANTYAGTTAVNAGTLAVTGTVQVNGASGVTVASGATLALSGTLKLASSAATIDVAAGGFFTAGGTLDLGNRFDTFNGGADGSYTLVAGAGSKSGAFFVSGYDSAVWSSVAFNASTGLLTFTAVPEPSTYGLIGASFLAVVAFVRRRRKARA